MNLDWNHFVPVQDDLIWIVSPKLLLHYPLMNDRFLDMVQTCFGTDEYPGEHHEPSFNLEEITERTVEIVTLFIYYPNTSVITNENVNTFSAFVSINYDIHEGTMTMWNLCSMDRGKGYAGRLVDLSIVWCRDEFHLPLHLKVYVYNPMFEQVVSFYLRRNFIFQDVERNGKVVAMIYAPKIKKVTHLHQSFLSIICQCWDAVLHQPPSNERKWLAHRLLSLLPKQRL